MATKDNWDWIASGSGRDRLEELRNVHSAPLPFDVAKSILKRFGDGRGSCLIEQLELAGVASKKFAAPEDWLWTRRLLEQSSDQTIAEYVADCFPDSAIVDLCCGAGADAVAIAKQRTLEFAADIDPVAAVICAANLARHQLHNTVLNKDVTQIDIPSACGVHIDPDRRQQGTKTTNIDFVEPSSGFLERLKNESPFGSVKLAPATDLEDSIFASCGRQWIESRRQVRQQRVWWGNDKFPPGSRMAAICIRDTVHEYHKTDTEIQSAFDHVEYTDEISTYLTESSASIRSARLNESFAVEHDAKIVGGRHGYLVSENYIDSPFARSFRVIERSSLDVKRLRKLCRAQDIGRIVIKKRGVEMDIDRLSKDLRLGGRRNAVLFLLRVEKRRFAVLCEETGESHETQTGN